MGDLNTFQERFVALRHRLIDDGIANGVPFSIKDLNTLIERSKCEGSSFIKVTIPQLGKALDRGLVNGQFSPIINFRSKRNTCLPIWCHDVFTDIFQIDGMLRSEPNVVSLRYLRQFLLLDGKLITEPTNQQKRDAYTGFRSRMDDLRKKKIQQDHPVLVEARNLLSRVLPDSLLDVIKPGHGPGVVAERKDRMERWDFRTWPSLAERYYPYLTYGTHSLEAYMRTGYGVKWESKPTTRCCLVPKDFKGPRLISAESAATQYLQQGQMRKLMHYCDTHPLIGRSIQFRDQTLNQRAAQSAVSRHQVTLDLSNASDTVSLPLVWFLLSGVPGLRRRLVATRSSFMEMPDGPPQRISAFAPMGSAVCFPIESLVFWAISMASLKLVRSHVNRSGKRICSFSDNALASEISVFGDDIIIPEDAFPTLSSTLLEIGCEPNMSKTCWQTPFRESCGSEWFNGIDVTIIRNKEYHYAADNKFEDHLALLNLQRKFFLQGMFSAAALLKDWAEEIFPIYELPVNAVLNGVSERNLWGESALDPSWPLLEAIRKSSAAPSDNDRAFQYRIRIGSARVDPNEGNEKDTSPWRYFAWLSSQPLDKYSCAFGHGYRVSPRLRVRWNTSYQRYECRVIRPFQKSYNWPSPERVQSSRPRGWGDTSDVESLVLRSQYARLLARIAGDSIERVASRDITVRSAWSILPLPFGLSPEYIRG